MTSCSRRRRFRALPSIACWPRRASACDVASGGELALALRGGFDPARIYFHGNAKSAAELRQALDAGVGHVVLDSFDEIDRLTALAARRELAARRS